MRPSRRLLTFLSLGALVACVPATSYAGGGVGGGGGGFFGGASVTVDNVPPANHNWGYLDYFPRNAVVAQGQTVTFTWANNMSEPHTVAFIPAGIPFNPNSQGALNKLYPGNANPIPDTDDHPAGLYQDINVRQQVGCGNSPYFPGTGACNWDGRSALNSGVMFGGVNHGTWTVRMNAAPGVYHYYCLIHGPNMSGTIRVLPAGASAPSAAAQAAAAASQHHWATVNTLAHEASVSAAASHPAPGGHTAWIIRAGDQYGRVAINEFLPTHPSIRAGDTVMWTPGFHTVTFPAHSGAIGFTLDCERPGADRRAGASPVNIVSVAGCLGGELAFTSGLNPSGPTGRPYTGGFYNSGVLVIPSPHTWSATFPSGGTFQYECLVHHGMVASITVQ